MKVLRKWLELCVSYPGKSVDYEYTYMITEFLGEDESTWSSWE